LFLLLINKLYVMSTRVALLVILIAGTLHIENAFGHVAPRDTIVVEASAKSIKHQNRSKSNGRISFWDAPTKRFASTPFNGPAGYQIQKVSIPMKCQCAEVDSFEVTLIYTDLESCASTVLYQNWLKLEGLKELQIVPMLGQKTHAHFVLSINLRPNRFPKDHPGNIWNACFYLKSGLVASNHHYYLLDGQDVLTSPADIYENGKNYTLSPRMKLQLFK